MIALFNEELVNNDYKANISFFNSKQTSKIGNIICFYLIISFNLKLLFNILIY